MKEHTSPLDFLPEAMVDEMLSKHRNVVDTLSGSLHELSGMKNDIRKKLEDIGMLKNVNDMLGTESYPTTAGTDGTYAIIKQLAVDTICIAAVAVEGLIPPKETRKWETPHHVVKVFPVEHSEFTQRLCRSLMFAYELRLATNASHSVVFLDGSLTSLLIGIGQGLRTAHDKKNPPPKELQDILFELIEDTLEKYQKVLTSPRVDQIFAGVPKYSSRREIIDILKQNGISSVVLERSNDKAILSLVLKAGDVVGPVALESPKSIIVGPDEFESPKSLWHLSGEKLHYKKLENEKGTVVAKSFQNSVGGVKSAMKDIHVLYIRTSPAHPTLRIEISSEVARNQVRLSILLKALMDQARIPGILEPYPLFLADLFAKNAFMAVSELREAAFVDVDRIAKTDFEDIFLALQDYRTEGGFD